ncbi:MAG: acyl carrier protein, partial [Planctomycetes bacterium]|nr:acyl carrier protein [Planctomycetota bacterium]
MGLDAVELVLEAEEAFHILLADDEISGMVTAGDLHQAILRQLPEPKRTLCLTAATFYRIRRTLVEIT